MSWKFEDILYHEHHVSTDRRPMSRHDRAAQFAPFSALTGLEEEIEEAERWNNNFWAAVDATVPIDVAESQRAEE